ncbi:hypothetical protein MFLAVUS_000530 [Mucor flavus]|uniref:Uncharacterized protein n=1 Tax=Mucor flavus TaxID=439312 RepID=A0ABP9YJY8_9FUNG
MDPKFKEHFSCFTKQQLEELQVLRFKTNSPEQDTAEPRISVDESPNYIIISSEEEMSDIEYQDTFDVPDIIYISSDDELMDIDNDVIMDIDNDKIMDIDEDDQLYNGARFNNRPDCRYDTATLQNQEICVISSSDEFSPDSGIIPSRGLRKRIKTRSRRGVKKTITDLSKRDDDRDRYRYPKRGKPREPPVSVDPGYKPIPCQFNTINKGAVNTSTIIRDKRNYRCAVLVGSYLLENPPLFSGFVELDSTLKPKLDTEEVLLYEQNYTARKSSTMLSMLMKMAGDENSLLNILYWFKSGTSVLHNPPTDASNEELSEITKRRVRRMRGRARSLGVKIISLVTQKELFEICKSNDMKCAITGHRLYFGRSDNSFPPFWKASFDHIRPLNYSKHDPTSWSANNLQLMSSLLNCIKGHMPDQEIVKWYSNVKHANVLDL